MPANHSNFSLSVAPAPSQSGRRTCCLKLGYLNVLSAAKPEDYPNVATFVKHPDVPVLKPISGQVMENADSDRQNRQNLHYVAKRDSVRSYTLSFVVPAICPGHLICSSPF